MQPTTTSRPHRGPRRPTPAPPLCVLALALALAPAVAGGETGLEPVDPERFVFLLEYVATDYASAVRDGAVVDEAEYREMRLLSGSLVDRFDDLRRLGASETSLGVLIDLRRRIDRRDSAVDIRIRGLDLAERLLAELDLRPLPAHTPDPGRGGVLYVPDCAPCHGEAGRGDGRAAPGMQPPPTAFVDASGPSRTAHQLYGAIRFGVPGTAMPSYHDALTNEQIWDLAYFVRGLGAAGAVGDLAGVLRGDADPRVRRWAAWRLGRSEAGTADALDALLEAGKDPDPLVRGYAERALVTLGPRSEAAVPHLVAALRETRSRAAGVQIATALGRIGKASVAPLIEVLEHADNPFTREQAIRALGFVGPDASDAVPRLVEMLAGDDGRLRFEAASALGAIRAAPAVPALAERVAHDTSATVRRYAIDALGAIGAEAVTAVPALIDVFEGDDGGALSGRAALALAEIGPPAFPHLVSALERSNPWTRAYATLALGRCEVASSRRVPPLVTMLHDDDERVRDRATAALAALGRDAVPALAEVLTADPSPKARGHAALALGRMSPPVGDAAPALTAALDDADATVRQIAGWSLGKLGADAAGAVRALARSLSTADPGMRRMAAWALGNIGTPAASAERALEAALADTDPGVRKEVDEALRKLHGTYEGRDPSTGNP